MDNNSTIVAPNQTLVSVQQNVNLCPTTYDTVTAVYLLSPLIRISSVKSGGLKMQGIKIKISLEIEGRYTRSF